jgi:hypothetical protein
MGSRYPLLHLQPPESRKQSDAIKVITDRYQGFNDITSLCQWPSITKSEKMEVTVKTSRMPLLSI